MKINSCLVACISAFYRSWATSAERMLSTVSSFVKSDCKDVQVLFKYIRFFDYINKPFKNLFFRLLAPSGVVVFLHSHPIG